MYFTMKYWNGFISSTFLFNLQLFKNIENMAFLAGHNGCNKLRKQVETNMHLLKCCLPAALFSQLMGTSRERQGFSVP